MAVKRRIVWFSDEDWAALQDVAESRDETVSQTIRSMWVDAAAAVPFNADAPMPKQSPVSIAMAQAERDRLRKGKV